MTASQRAISAAVSTRFDLVTIGRVSVDLYGQQIGSRLEDAATFAKGVGGCPANVAIGAARLGLKCALISRVGDEPMGRFVREQLEREGVDTRGVGIDPQRLTSLVLLSVRDPDTFPLIFYRDNCADAALCEADIDEDLVGSAKAILLTGTHFSIPAAARAQRKAIGIARALGIRVILDIDYRPSLWGIGGYGAGETRYARSARVTGVLASVLPDCDLIVGTEEELHVAAGFEDTLGAVRHIRTVSNAVIICKRGGHGCIVFDGPIADTLEAGRVVPGLEVEVYNVLGAGDAFLAGFLYGYLRDAPHETSARFANACGALAVSRLLCSSEYPTLAELEHLLAHGSAHRALRQDARLGHLHWATTRVRGPSSLRALALGSRAPQRLASLVIDAAARVAAGREGFGVVLSGDPAAAAMRQTGGSQLWVARSVERTHSLPLEFEGGPSVAVQLIEWPVGITVACECRYRADDPHELRDAQERELLRLATACRAQRRELLLGISVGEGGESHDDAVARALSRLYELGIRPDWWALEGPSSARALALCAEAIAAGDGYCRGILLGLTAPGEAPEQLLALAARCPAVRGFIAGGSIVAAAAEAWLSGQASAEAATLDIARRFRALTAAWDSARSGH